LLFTLIIIRAGIGILPVHLAKIYVVNSEQHSSMGKQSIPGMFCCLRVTNLQAVQLQFALIFSYSKNAHCIIHILI
jgi:hypothetical protein